MLGLPGPPTTFGLYRDGNRLRRAAAAGPGRWRATRRRRWARCPTCCGRIRACCWPAPPAASASPRRWRSAPAQITALEPEPVLRAALRRGLRAVAAGRRAGHRPPARSPRCGRAAATTSSTLPAISWTRPRPTRAPSPPKRSPATSARCAPGGIVSIPVSIREFPAYALRMLATARAALLRGGRSPTRPRMCWSTARHGTCASCSPTPPFDAARIAAAKKFCDQTVPSTSRFFPGMDVAAARANIYNDLPAVSFEEGEVTSGEGPHDAIADEAGPVLAATRRLSSAPSTLARSPTTGPPSIRVLRLDRARHDPAVGWNCCRRRRSGRW